MCGWVSKLDARLPYLLGLARCTLSVNLSSNAKLPRIVEMKSDLALTGLWQTSIRRRSAHQ
jgi:hypothetical protein